MHCVAMSGARMLQCACCHIEVLICAPCDLGQRYCSAACRSQARLANQRRNSQRYQKTRRGRFNHARRQRCLRERQKERQQERQQEQQQESTAKNSDSSPPSQEACADAVLPPRLDVRPEIPTKPTPAWHCHWCARPVASGVWRSGLRLATNQPKDDP